jgi:indolepyruvate ferredoxin oxidoreductase, beta subunit
MSARPLTISLHALGGQGGGVLADWIVAVARKAGWLAQATSVPGVAQRTGATIYYIELFPDPAATPVLALMPSRGDVDLVLASELMEAGRAINRGLVTPDRTTLVATSSRAYSVGEKSAMGDGRFASGPIVEAATSHARRLVLFDMDAAAEETGSHINAVLLGAAANSGALPFARAYYEAVIRDGGLSVDANLAGFAAGYDNAARSVTGAAPAPRQLNETERLVTEGERRLVDYQDRAYAQLYRKRLARFAGLERPDGLLTRELARYLALWMSFEDTIRVADLKTRAERFARVRDEVRAKPGQIVRITEYLHPRVEELCDTMPAWLGALVLRTGWLRRLIAWAFARGRHVTTSDLGGYLLLSFIASLRGARRATLRHMHENAKIEDWLARCEVAARSDYGLAVEIARCQRLIKGYGDTYDRGWSSFAALMARAPSVTAAELAALREAALVDSEGAALTVALAQSA